MFFDLENRSSTPGTFYREDIVESRFLILSNQSISPKTMCGIQCQQQIPMNNAGQYAPATT
jgi:hypothetical protein